MPQSRVIELGDMSDVPAITELAPIRLDVAIAPDAERTNMLQRRRSVRMPDLSFTGAAPQMSLAAHRRPPATIRTRGD
jgi:hypothetical protein